VATRGRSAKLKGSSFEREIALELGGKRTPLSGASGGGDITLPPDSPWHAFSWEAKRRERLPVLLTGALAQAELDIAIGDPRRPAAAFREDHGRTIVAFYLDDIRRMVEALTDVGGGSRIRELARELERVAQELRSAVR
jgi:hypothetical protein